MGSFNFKEMTFLGEKYNPIEIIQDILKRDKKESVIVNLLFKNTLRTLMDYENAVALPDAVEEKDVFIYIASIVNELIHAGYDIVMIKKGVCYQLKLSKRKTFMIEIDIQPQAAVS